MNDHRPIDPREVIYNLRALAKSMNRNARLMERLYTDDAAPRAAQLRLAAHTAESWATEIEAAQEDHACTP